MKKTMKRIVCLAIILAVSVSDLQAAAVAVSAGESASVQDESDEEAVSASSAESGDDVDATVYYTNQIPESVEYDIENFDVDSIADESGFDLDSADFEIVLNTDLDDEITQTDLMGSIYDALYEHYLTNSEKGSVEIEIDALMLLTVDDAAYEDIADGTDAGDFINALATEMLTEYFSEIAAIPAHAFLMDHPEIFFIEDFEISVAGVSYYTEHTDSDGNETSCVEIGVSSFVYEPNYYYDGAENDIEEFNESVDSVCDEIEALFGDDDTTYDKAKVIHDYLTERLTYSKNAVRTASTAFLDDEDGEYLSICEGYSKAFKIICDRFDIPCILVNGSSCTFEGTYEDHMWNDVLIDGEWYAMDVAWDDQGIGTMYIYFLAGYESTGFYDIFSVDHLEDTDFWGDGYFIIKYPQLAEDYYDYIATSIEMFEVGTLSSVTYTGEAVEPEVSVSIGGTSLTEGVDYTVEYVNNTEIGTASVVVTGIGNYTGEVVISFEIEPIDITAAVVATDTPQLWNGTAREALDSVIVGGKTLVEGEDYTVEYADNIDVGTGKIYITGIGNYTGTTTASFEIIKVPLSTVTIKSPGSCTYTGSAIKPTISSMSLSVDGVSLSLVCGTDYTVSYKNNTNVGTATITITGKGEHFTGSTSTTFKIVAKSISSASVSSISNKTYTGSAIKPSPTVKVSGKTLKKGTDYTLSYSSNKSTGKAKITIKGTGNYTGSKTVYFYIVPKKISVKSVTSPKKKTLKISWTKTSTVSGYEIQYSTSKSFSSKKTIWVKSYKTTSKTITGLKSKKKYYIRIRGYKTVSGTKKYGNWVTKTKTTK